MGNMITYLTIVTGILLLFHYTGIIESGEGSVILDIITNPENIRNIPTSGVIELSIAGILSAGIAIAVFYGASLELLAMSTIALFFWNLLTDMLVIYNKIVAVNANYIPIATILVAVPFLILLIVIVDWWRGRST